MKEKKCFKCGLVKPLSEFYRHNQMADGYLNKCKECAKADANKNRESNIEYYREYDRKRFQKFGSRRKTHQRDNGNIHKYKARTKVGNALRSGKLTKPNTCSVCGSSDKPIEAHHKDHYKPLEVQWVCRGCHWDIHRELKKLEEILNG